MATIKDVAEMAGVSIGTVSHVITGSIRVSEPLRLKVQTAIRELDYHPNHVARSLKTNRTRTFGIVVPDMTISFFPQIIRGAEAAARQRNYSVIAVNSDDDGPRQKEVLSLLRSQRVDGILLVLAAAPKPTAQILKMVEAGIPFVCLDRIPDKLSIDSVAVEDCGAACMGVEHLIARGKRRIAIVTGPLSLKNESGRLLGYQEAHQRAGLPLDETLIWEGNLDSGDVAAICRKHLSTCRPDAIFATNGPTGLGALRGIYASGLRTPEDIAFVTFDELTVDDLFRPSITAVVQPSFEIGYQGTEILLQRVEEGPGEPKTIRLPAILKVRESSGAAVAIAGKRKPG